MVAEWYDLRLEAGETRVRALPWALASSGRARAGVPVTRTSRCMSPQCLRSPNANLRLALPQC